MMDLALYALGAVAIIATLWLAVGTMRAKKDLQHSQPKAPLQTYPRCPKCGIIMVKGFEACATADCPNRDEEIPF